MRCGSKLVENPVEIFRLDHQIRLLAQREESLRYKASALKKTTDIMGDLEQLEVGGFERKISKTQIQRFKDEYTLFRRISELPLWTKDLYHSLTLNPL